MRKFSSVQHQKQKLSIPSPYSFEQPVRQLAPILSPALQSVPLDGDAQLEQAHLFGHTLDQISLFPPARHAPVFTDQGQHTTDMLPPQHSVQYVFSQVLQEQDSVPPENHTGLPDTLKAGVENLSGFSLDDVRVHYNSSEPDQMQALAYTQGTDIYMGPGQEQHLAHEAWHVVQQMQGRVRPTVQAKGMPINDDVGLEREADVMGKKVNAIQDRPLQVARPDPSCIREGNIMQGMFGVIQRMNGKGKKSKKPSGAEAQPLSSQVSAKGRVLLQNEDEGISVYVESHQQKHQITQIGGLPAYTGGKGTQFPRNVDEEYHRTKIAPIVMDWAIREKKAIIQKRKLLPGKYELSDIIDFDVTAVVSEGNKIEVAYHCNPNRDSNDRDFK